VEQARYLLCSVCMPNVGCNWEHAVATVTRTLLVVQ